jgi:hypothetical protein
MNYRDTIGYENEAIPATTVSPATTHSLLVLAKAILERIGNTDADGDPSIISDLLSTYAEVISAMVSKAFVGTLTAADATGTENELFSHVPIGVANPQILKLNFDNMVAGDAIIVRLYYRYASEGGWVQEDYQPYAGIDGGLANGSKSISIKLDPNPYGVRVTLAQTSGTARAFGWFAVIDE